MSERSFAWLNRNRGLTKDFETTMTSSKACISRSSGIEIRPVGKHPSGAPERHFGDLLNLLQRLFHRNPALKIFVAEKTATNLFVTAPIAPAELVLLGLEIQRGVSRIIC